MEELPGPVPAVVSHSPRFVIAPAPGRISDSSRNPLVAPRLSLSIGSSGNGSPARPSMAVYTSRPDAETGAYKGIGGHQLVTRAAPFADAQMPST